ncbi:MAG: hypothetical protein AAF171_07335 [Cyanobacteria bacterium P01_A01_bin.116]
METVLVVEDFSTGCNVVVMVITSAIIGNTSKKLKETLGLNCL